MEPTPPIHAAAGSRPVKPDADDRRAAPVSPEQDHQSSRAISDTLDTSDRDETAEAQNNAHLPARSRHRREDGGEWGLLDVTG